mmetsp:Transcript_23133/g.57530  ORF Transcript_23133/g.57530 Transcript_23133/m.57530 type:complete len:229 (+) Transcript_23133:752-1438(+)
MRALQRDFCSASPQSIADSRSTARAPSTSAHIDSLFFGSTERACNARRAERWYSRSPPSTYLAPCTMILLAVSSAHMAAQFDGSYAHATRILKDRLGITSSLLAQPCITMARQASTSDHMEFLFSDSSAKFLSAPNAYWRICWFPGPSKRVAMSNAARAPCSSCQIATLFSTAVERFHKTATARSLASSSELCPCTASITAARAPCSSCHMDTLFSAHDDRFHNAASA